MTIVERGVLADEARAELVAVAKGKSVAGVFALRARIVVWWDEGRSAREIVSLSGMSEPTVRLWPERYRAEGVDGLFGKPHPGKGPVHGGKVRRARILALSRQSPPPELGVTHWSSRLLASCLRREGITVSHVFVFHFTPVSGSFMNQVETWFGVITKQAIRRGTFKSVAHLIRRINDYYDAQDGETGRGAPRSGWGPAGAATAA